ncbi:hypothetical protein Tco_1405261 [Tanacetum coccineum]
METKDIMFPTNSLSYNPASPQQIPIPDEYFNSQGHAHLNNEQCLCCINTRDHIQSIRGQISSLTTHTERLLNRKEEEIDEELERESREKEERKKEILDCTMRKKRTTNPSPCVEKDLCRLFHLAILCLDQHAHAMHHLESLLTISLENLCLDNLDIFKEDLEYQSLWKSLSLYELELSCLLSLDTNYMSFNLEYEHAVMNPISLERIATPSS